MTYLSDIEIAQNANMQPIGEIAHTLGVADEYLEPYGKYKAKINPSVLKRNNNKSKLVLVTAINLYLTFVYTLTY